MLGLSTLGLGFTAFAGGSNAPLEVGAAFFDDSDDFDSPSGVNSISGRTGWTLSGGDMATDDTMTGLGGDGVLRLNSAFGSATGSFGSLCDGAHEVQFEFRTGDDDAFFDEPWASNLHKYVLWSDADSYLAFNLDTGNSRIVLNTQDDDIASGNETFRTSFNKANTGSFTAPVQGVLTPQINGSAELRVYVDKVPLKSSAVLGPDSKVDISSWIGSGHRKGQPAVFGQNYGYPLITNIDVRASAWIFHDEENSDRAAGHIAFGGSTGQPKIEADYTGTPTEWIFRIWHTSAPDTMNIAFPGANAQGWRRITPTSDTGSHVVLRPILPDGNWIVEYGFKQADGSYVSTHAFSILIARKILVHGQSNAIRRSIPCSTGIVGALLAGINAQTYSPPNSLVPYYPGNYIIHGADTVGYDGNYCSWHLANTVVTLSGEPCIVVVCGEGGQSLSNLVYGSDGWTRVMDFLDALPGVVEDVVWDHGEAVIASAGWSSEIASYTEDMTDGIITPMRDKWGAGVRFYMSIQGSYASDTLPDIWGSDWDGFNAAVSALRLVQAGMCAEFGGSDPNIHIDCFRTQINHEDGYHHSGNAIGVPKLCERDGQTISKHAYGVSTHDGAGAFITSVVRTADFIDVILNMNGATGLSNESYTSSPITSLPNKTGTVWGWFVAKDSAPTTPLAFTIGAGSTAGRVGLTLTAGDPGEPCRVYLWHGGQWDDQTAVCGTYASGDPIPIQPSLDVANGRAYFLTAS